MDEEEFDVILTRWGGERRGMSNIVLQEIKALLEKLEGIEGNQHG